MNLSVRQYLAGQALSGLIAQYPQRQDEPAMIETAFRIADAMVAYDTQHEVPQTPSVYEKRGPVTLG